MFKLFGCILFLILGFNSKKFHLIPFEENGLWGYVDQNVNMQISIKFDSVSVFENQRAIVKYNGKFGVIDMNGNYVLRPSFKAIELNSVNGFVAKKNNSNKNFYDYYGKRVNKLKISGSCGASMNRQLQVENYSIKKGNRWALIFNRIFSDKNLMTTVYKDTSEYIYSSVSNFGKSSFIIEYNGKFGVWCPSEIGLRINFCYENLCKNSKFNEYPAYYKFMKNGRWGILNSYMVEQTAAKYVEIYEDNYAYYQELILVKVKVNENKYGYIDIAGNEYF